MEMNPWPENQAWLDVVVRVVRDDRDGRLEFESDDPAEDTFVLRELKDDEMVKCEMRMTRDTAEALRQAIQIVLEASPRQL